MKGKIKSYSLCCLHWEKGKGMDDENHFRKNENFLKINFAIFLFASFSLFNQKYIKKKDPARKRTFLFYEMCSRERILLWHIIIFVGKWWCRWRWCQFKTFFEVISIIFPFFSISISMYTRFFIIWIWDKKIVLIIYERKIHIYMRRWISNIPFTTVYLCQFACSFRAC